MRAREPPSEASSVFFPAFEPGKIFPEKTHRVVGWQGKRVGLEIGRQRGGVLALCEGCPGGGEFGGFPAGQSSTRGDGSIAGGITGGVARGFAGGAAGAGAGGGLGPKSGGKRKKRQEKPLFSPKRAPI
jgi:hypothetical protein